jgi:hypothetical protein
VQTPEMRARAQCGRTQTFGPALRHRWSCEGLPLLMLLMGPAAMWIWALAAARHWWSARIILSTRSWTSAALHKCGLLSFCKLLLQILLHSIVVFDQFGQGLVL